MNELTTAGPLGEGLGRRWGVQGARSGIISTIASDLFTVQHADVSKMDDELLVLMGYGRYAAIAAEAASAVLFSHVFWSNPSNSGRIAVLEEFRITSATEVNLRISPGPAALDTNGRPLDGRVASEASALGLGSGTSADPAVNFGQPIYRILAAATALPNVFPYVLTPGRILVFSNGLVNTGITVAARWRERKAESWEL